MLPPHATFAVLAARWKHGTDSACTAAGMPVEPDAPLAQWTRWLDELFGALSAAFVTDIHACDRTPRHTRLLLAAQAAANPALRLATLRALLGAECDCQIYISLRHLAHGTA